MNSLIKNFDTEISIIENLENFASKKIKSILLNGEANLTKINRQFQLYFKGKFTNTDSQSMSINIDGILYKIKSYDFTEPSTKYFREVACENTFDIHSISKGNLKDKTFFKMFFFDDSSRSDIFYTKIERPRHDGKIPWSHSSVRMNMNDIIYDISQYKQKGVNYIIIENLTSTNYNDFKKDSYAIQKAIGFLCGYMTGGENYLFSGQNFKYNNLDRPALKSLYYPVTSNPYSFVPLHGNKEIAEDYQKKLKVIPSSVVSNFAIQIRDNEDLSVAIIFLMEVLHLKSLISMPGVFSIILESLANIIINPLNIRAKLIVDNNLYQKIFKDLNKVIDIYASQLDVYELNKIRNRIKSLNQPVNVKRISNTFKLREPFDQLGIILSESDEESINYRNSLLHGNILMHDNNISRSSKEIDNHMMYISLKLYTLISKLILKNCGFNGYVINHAKIHLLIDNDIEKNYFDEI